MINFLFALGAPIFALLWVILCFPGEPFTVILSLLSALLACGCIVLMNRGRRANLAKTGLDYNSLHTCSPREITILMLQEAIKTHTQGKYKPVAKTAVFLRCLATGIFLITGSLVLEFLYFNPWLAPTLGGLFLLYTLIFQLTDTLSFLALLSKRYPKKGFDAIVTKEVVNATSLCRALVFGGIGLCLTVLVLFCGLHLQPRWNFEVKGQECTLISYQAPLFGAKDVQIPNEYKEKPVTVIGEKAFAYAPIDTVTLPDSVHTVKKQAFAACKQLKQVTLSSNLQVLDSGAFKDCRKLSDITLPESLQVLNGEAFMNCAALSRIVIPEGVTEIRGSTFEGCSALKYVTWHDTITAIHAKAFRDCSALTNIALPPKITEIREATFENCSSLTFVSIPIGVTRIAAHSFMGCSKLSEVYVPDTVTQIRSSAFRNCPSLKTIELPDGITVDERAFKESPTKIVKKTIPDAFWTQAIAESRDKDTTVFYCVYETAKGADSIMYWNDPDTVLVADDEKISQLCSEDWSVLVCNGYSELKSYLQKAEAAGIRQVLYGRYSQMASEKLDTCYFFSNTWMLDDTIALCDEKIAESENG